MNNWYGDELSEHMEWRKSLKERFPELFRQDRYLEVSVARGWHTLIEELLTNIQMVVCERGGVFAVRQIKEKFGGLRFYCEGSDEMIKALIVAAEERAVCTCEWCGGTGENRLHTGWWKVLCDEHNDAWVKRHD